MYAFNDQKKPEGLGLIQGIRERMQPRKLSLCPNNDLTKTRKM